MPLKWGSNGQTSKKRKGHTNVVTYFCMVTESGELETLHFFAGFPTAELLQTHCEWASELQMQLKTLSNEKRPTFNDRIK